MAVLGTMEWSNLFLAHWEVPAAPLASFLPRELSLDLFRGEAWLSLAALRARGPAPGPLPPPSLEPVFAYDQVNVRTYVNGPAGPGIFLLDSVLNGRLAAFFGRRIGLPYRYERTTHVHRGPSTMSVATQGLAIYADVSGPRLRTPRPKSREHFLVERYTVYTLVPGGLAIAAMRIEHEPWRLRTLSLATALPSSVVGFPGAADPALVHTAPDFSVRLTSIETHATAIASEIRDSALSLV